jgi:unsaturated chondroitin disaccharide hydrolase
MDYQLIAEDREWAEDVFEKLRVKLKAECSRLGDMIPYISRDGHYHDLDSPDGIYWWTNGFWPGMLWQMYHATKDEVYRETAGTIEKRLDKALEGWEGLHHDVGFMWLHSAVANYRLTGNKDSRRRGLHTANLLAGRYNPAGKFIRAWNGDCTGWIIIDCMMNIPLLYWASGETNDPRFSFIAQNHSDTASNTLVRPDGSCNHIAVLSPETGECLETPGGQGYAAGSSWSRGGGFSRLSRRGLHKWSYAGGGRRLAGAIGQNPAQFTAVFHSI